MRNCDLNSLFNPDRISYFFSLSDSPTDKVSNEISDTLTNRERKYFKEICKELEKDLEGLGFSVNFSSKILIRKLALNIILLKKIIYQSFGSKLIRNVPKKIIPLKNGLTRTYTPMYHDTELHPFFEKSIIKFQKEIDTGFKNLGLLPLQQIERQKLVIIKKLKQKYANLCGEVSIEAIQKTIKIPNRSLQDYPLVNQNQ